MAVDSHLDADARAEPGDGDGFLDAVTRQGIDHRALAGAPVAVVAVGLDGLVRSWNDAATRLLGWTADEVLGEVVPFLPEHNLDDAARALDLLLDGSALSDVTFSPKHKDGSTLHVVASASLLRDERGAPDAVLAFLTDVTAETEAARAVAHNEHKWRTMLQHISDTVTLLDVEGNVLETSGQFTDVLGYDSDDWEGTDAFSLIHPDDRPLAISAFAFLLEHPGEERREVLRTLHAEGHHELVEYTGINVLDDESVGGIVLTTRNVTAVKEAEALLASEARVLELIARDAPVGETLAEIATQVEIHTGGTAGVFSMVDPDQRLRLGGAGAHLSADLTTAIELIPASWLDEQYRRNPEIIVHSVPDLAASRSDAIIAAHRDALVALGVGAVQVVPVVDRRSDELFGVLVWYHPHPHHLTAHEHETGRAFGHLAAIALERSRAQAELEHAARHDALTGLPNRRVVTEHLDDALARSRARDHESRVGVLFIDLDRFKVINDSLGHAAADRLIARFAGRLTNLVRPGDLVGHWAADEFVVVLDDLDGIDDAWVIARRVEQSLQEPFALPEGEVFLSASVGIALSGENDAVTTETLLQHADAALHRAKELGRSRAHVFDRDLRFQAVEQLSLERDLRLALERLELAMHYQPEIDLATGRIVGAEALMRWHHPERGLVLPGEFIHIAEENGMIRRLGRWALEEAVRQAAAWAEAVPDLGPFTMGVNLSARQLTAPEIVTDVERILRFYDWPPEQLMIELTETVLIHDRELAIAALTRLKALGVRLALDDFGTGYSSLNYLHRFPVDVVKVDQSFVADLDHQGEGSPIAAAVLHVARALGLTTCAEGVEEPHQLAGLRALGCHLAQGFLFAEALPATDFAALLHSDRTW